MTEPGIDGSGGAEHRADAFPGLGSSRSGGHEPPPPVTVPESPGQPDAAPTTRADWFRTTHWSVVLAAQEKSSPDAGAALEKLCRTYWYPLYAYIRRWGRSPHDAQDLTQEFFARLLEKDYLASVAREKGKFRSFLLAALNHFLSHQYDRARAVKRGGGAPVISLDETAVENLYSVEAPGTTPEAAFERRWAVTVMETAFASVREDFLGSGKGQTFEHLKSFLGHDAPSGDYGKVGQALGMSANSVAVAVHRLRQKYREAIRLEIAHTVSSPDEIEGEMRHLLAALR